MPFVATTCESDQITTIRFLQVVGTSKHPPTRTHVAPFVIVAWILFPTITPPSPVTVALRVRYASDAPSVGSTPFAPCAAKNAAVGASTTPVLLTSPTFHNADAATRPRILTCTRTVRPRRLWQFEPSRHCVISNLPVDVIFVNCP